MGTDMHENHIPLYRIAAIRTIEAAEGGWSESRIQVVKTFYGVQNLRDAYPNRDLDEVQDGEQFVFNR